MSLSVLALMAEETADKGELAVSPYAVGGTALGILLLLLLGLLAFGAGREHS